MSPETHLHSIALSILEVGKPAKMSGKRSLFATHRELVGQAVKITCKHHKSFSQQQSMAMSQHKISLLSRWELLPLKKKKKKVLTFWRANKCKIFRLKRRPSLKGQDSVHIHPYSDGQSGEYSTVWIRHQEIPLMELTWHYPELVNPITGKKILLKTQNKYFTSFCAFALPPQTNTTFLWGAIIILIQISHLSLTLPRMGSRRSKTWWKRRNHSQPSQPLKKQWCWALGSPSAAQAVALRNQVQLLSGQN